MSIHIVREKKGWEHSPNSTGKQAAGYCRGEEHRADPTFHGEEDGQGNESRPRYWVLERARLCLLCGESKPREMSQTDTWIESRAQRSLISMNSPGNFRSYLYLLGLWPHVILSCRLPHLFLWLRFPSRRLPAYSPMHMCNLPLSSSASSYTSPHAGSLPQLIAFISVRLSQCVFHQCYNCYNMSSIYVYIRLWLIK